MQQVIYSWDAVYLHLLYARELMILFYVCGDKHFMFDVLHLCSNCLEAEQFGNVTTITILFSMQYMHSSITRF